MKELYLEILTPSKKMFEGNILSVTVPGTVGEFQVLFNHAPIISTLEIGRIKIKTANEPEQIFAVSTGVIEVLHNKVLILVKSIENVTEIDVARAEKAAERAKQRLHEKHNNEIDASRAEAALSRALNRIKLKSSY